MPSVRLRGTKRILPLPAAMVAIAALLAGCGGDAGGNGYQVRASTTMTIADPPLTKPQFVARVNAICREAWRTVWDNWEVYTSAQEPQLGEKERFAEAVRLSLLAGIDFHIFDNILDLGAPPGEQRRIEAIVGPFQEAVELGWADRWRAYSVAEVPPQFSQYNRLARRYGLDDCLVDGAHLRRLES